MEQLDGKIAIITGAGSGIGQAIATLFAREGARVVIADIKPSAAEETTSSIRQAGNQAIALHVDVTNDWDVQAMVESTIAAFGRVDILCNNAGIGHSGSIVECTEEHWDAVMAVNVKGIYLCMHHVLPHMLAEKEGSIINIASVLGLVGVPKRAVYSASKGAVIALTRQVAIEYARENIRANCICPTTVETPLVTRLLAKQADPESARQELLERQPVGRLGRPDEIAHAALYLASPQASFMTGSLLVIDGGMTAR
jgi:2-keto-3-deoxy-L-fuconate dehydrogenase